MLWILAALTPLRAQIPILQIGQPITEEFNSLESEQGQFSDVLPSGWELVETGHEADNHYRADNGSRDGWDTYSYGNTGSTDRALGILGGRKKKNKAFEAAFGARLVNQTGSLVDALSISFWGEEWHKGSASSSLVFSYSLDASSIDDPNATWVTVDALTVTRIDGAGKPGRRDGNDPENRAYFSALISGLNLAAGQTITIRWHNETPGGSEGDGLAIDDLTIVAAAPEPDAMAALAAGTLTAWAVVREHRRRAADRMSRQA